MSQEPFAPLRVWDEALKAHRNYQTVKCSECSTFENLAVTSRIAMPPEAIVKKMQVRGWVMGHRRRHDLCPACASKKNMTKPKVEKIADYLPKPSVKEAPVNKEQKPSRDEKRVILFAIEDHFDEKTRTYEQGWSDEKVASHLNVPRKWVADLREEFYGPLVDPEIAVLREAITAIETQMAATAAHLSDLRGKLNDIKERLSKKEAA